MYSAIRKIKSSHSTQLNIPRIEVRRSSSLQLRVSSPIDIDDRALSEVTAISRSSSVYSPNPSWYTANQKMHTWPSYVGCCQLRIASCLIGMLSIGISVVAICFLLSVSGNLSQEVQSVVTAPISSLVLLQIATALLLIVGVLINTHYLLIPFLLNTVIHVCLAIGIAITVIVSAHDIRKVYGPHIFLLCLVGLALYVWFTAVVAMTIALIRDKRRLGYDHQDDFDPIRPSERVSSSVI